MTFLPGPSSNLHQASLPSPVLACSWGEGSECQLEMPQATGLDDAQCTSDESESFGDFSLWTRVVSQGRCWLLCAFFISEMKRMQQRSKLNPAWSCPGGWITARNDFTPWLWKRKIYLLCNLVRRYWLCLVQRLEARGDFGLQRGLSRACCPLLSFHVSLSTQISHQEVDVLAGGDNSRMSLAEVKSFPS